ncbi:MAG: lipopolysaccharide heptosyltransferase II [Burkholderiaceae bacterium]
MALRTLVVAPQWIGDAVLSEPLLAALAARGEQLTVAALPWVAPVYRAMPQVGGVLEWPFAHGRLDWAARRGIAAGLRGQFDAAYVLPNSLKAALIPFLARIPQRCGYVGEGRVLLLNRRLPNPAGRTPMAQFYLALAGAHDAPVPSPRLSLGAQSKAAARAQVGASAYWVFAPGAEYGAAKCWPAEHFAALARALFERDATPVLLLGSPKEAALCEAIAGSAAPACRVLAGKTTLLEAMALIAAARGVVSNDSGLMHIAAALGVPQVAIFGSTSPLHTPPLNPRAQVLWLKDELGLDCAPCFERTCRFGHTRCLVELVPQRVEAALLQALQAGVAGAPLRTIAR